MTGDEDIEDDVNVDDNKDHNDAPAPQDDHKDTPQGGPQAMSLKKSPTPATAGSPKKPPTAATMRPPAAITKKPIVPYYLNMRDATVVAYYNKDDGVDYAKFEIHVNGMVKENSCHFMLTDDGMWILWQQAISSLKTALKG